MAFWNSSYDDPLDYTELWAPNSYYPKDVPSEVHNIVRDSYSIGNVFDKALEKRHFNNINNQAFSVMNWSLDSIARDLASAANPNDRNVQEEICARYGYSLHTLTDDDKKYIEQAIENY